MHDGLDTYVPHAMPSWTTSPEDLDWYQMKPRNELILKLIQEVEKVRDMEWAGKERYDWKCGYSTCAINILARLERLLEPDEKK